MDILAVILACSLHPDDSLVRVLIDVQSGGNVYFVGDLATLKSKDTLGSAEAALRFAEDLREHGGRPAVGLLGIPLEWASRYGRAPRELFDACTNVAVATAALAEYRDRCMGVSPPRSRRGGLRRQRHSPSTLVSRQVRYCILSRFSQDLGVGCVPGAILKILADERAASPVRSVDPPARSEIFLDVAAEGSPAPRRVGVPRVHLRAPDVAEGSAAVAVPAPRP